MHGLVARRALGLLLWASSTALLAGAMAIDPAKAPTPQPHEGTAHSNGEIESDGLTGASEPESASISISLDIPLSHDLEGSVHGPSRPHTLFLQVFPTGSPCGPANLSVNSQSLSLDDWDAGRGVFESADAHGPSFAASWTVSCIEAPARDGPGIPEASQLLSFEITSLHGRPVEASVASFIARFKQTEPAQIISVAGPQSVQLRVGDEQSQPVHGHDGASDDTKETLDAELADLDRLKRRVMQAERDVLAKERRISERFGLPPPPPPPHHPHGGPHCRDGLDCAWRKMYFRVARPAQAFFRDLIRKVRQHRGKKHGKECASLKDIIRKGKKAWSQHFGSGASGPGREQKTFGIPFWKPKSHPFSGKPDDLPPPPPGHAPSSGEGHPPPWTDNGDHPPVAVVVLLVFAAIVIPLALSCLACCLCCGTPCSRSRFSSSSRREDRRRQKEERRARRRARCQAAKASIGRLFRHIFCRASLEDEEKEAERQRMLEDRPAVHVGDVAERVAAAPRVSWGGDSYVDLDADGNVDLEHARPRRSATFVVGESDDEESVVGGRYGYGYGYRYGYRSATAQGRDAESITLVGGGSDSGRSEAGEGAGDEKAGTSRYHHKNHHDSDDAASESGSIGCGRSESGASESEASTTMETDLARFREATFMVGDMVAAEEARQRRRDNERQQQQHGQRGQRTRRPASPSGSLPGYASDDPFPPAYESTRVSVDEEALSRSMIADGFQHRPQRYSPGVEARASRDEKS